MTSHDKGVSVDDCKDNGVVSDNNESEQLLPNMQAADAIIIRTPIATPRQGSSLEYAKLWEELRYTSRGLDEVFEESKNSAFQLKELYDSIHQFVTINEGLQMKYYDALSTKKNFEEERDIYFKNDKLLLAKKNSFIEQSQHYALQHSKYVEYSKRFSNRREEYIHKLLTDVEKFYNRVGRLNKEKQELRHEISDVKQQMSKLRHDLSTKVEENKSLSDQYNLLAQKLKVKEEKLEWNIKLNSNLKEKNEGLTEEKKNLQNRTQQLMSDVKEQKASIMELSKNNRNLMDTCAQLNHQINAKIKEMERLNDDHNDQLKKRDDFEESLQNSIKDISKEKDNLFKSNHKLAAQHKDLLKKFTNTNMKMKKIEKMKNGIILNEHKTRDKNVELAEKQLELIDEVIMLKKGHFYDQARVKSGGKINKTTQKKVETLKKQVEILKKNPTVVDPENQAEDYREAFMAKLTSSSQASNHSPALLANEGSQIRIPYMSVRPQINTTLKPVTKQHVFKEAKPNWGARRNLAKPERPQYQISPVRSKTINLSQAIS